MFERPMRKPHKAIMDPAELEQTLLAARVLHLSMCLGDEPYVVPLNFGYEPGRIWCHTGHKGLKMDILAQNPRVCFSAVAEEEAVAGETPCKWDWRYRSVIGRGTAVVVGDEAEKRHGLELITSHYASRGPHELPPEKVRMAAVLRIDISQLRGKRNL